MDITTKYILKNASLQEPPKPEALERGVLKARHVYEALAGKFRDHIWVFFDLETTGLPAQIEEVQITQLSAVAVEMGDFEHGETGFTPVHHGEYHADIHLSDETFRNLDAARGGPTFRALLKHNKYNLQREHERRGAPFVDVETKSFSKKPNIPEFQHHGPTVNITVKPQIVDPIEEAHAIQGMEDFLGKLRAGGKEILVLAHNAKFDHDMFMGRAEMLGVPTPNFEATTVLDTLKVMKLYFEPVVKAMEDKTIHTRIESMFAARNAERKAEHVKSGKLESAFKPARMNWALDDVNAVLGLLKKEVAHTSHGDVENLIKVTAKALILIREAGDLDIMQLHQQAEIERKEFDAFIERMAVIDRDKFLQARAAREQGKKDA